MSTDTEVISAKALYEQLAQDRVPFLKRARRAAELTVPYLFPEEGVSASTDFKEPSQGLGARGVRHLASKLQLALFPINTPFFKYTIDDIALEDLTQAVGQRGEVEKALNVRERAVVDEMNGSLFRPVSFEVCRQLIVSGNGLIHIPKKGKVRWFRLSSYVVKRDPTGEILDIVIKETRLRATLPEDILTQIGSVDTANELPRDAKVDIFTKISLNEDGKKYIVTQEIDDVPLNGDYTGEYPRDALPWVPLRFTYLEGEDYGRSFCDEYIGDLNSLDVLTEALRDGTVQGAKVIWLVNPNSTVSVKRLSEAENGAFVQGQPEAVTPLRLDKQADFAVAKDFIATLTERLSFAFMLNSAVQRGGERVTAEEIRYVATELDQGMGGVYSLQAEEFQLPVAKLFDIRMQHKRKVGALPKEITSTAIVTGLDALGRGNDLANLDALIAGASQVVGSDAVGRYLNVGEYFNRRGAAIGIDMQGLIRSEEEIQKADEQAQMMAMAQHMGPQAIAQMGGMAKQQMVNDASAEVPAE